MAYHGPLQLTDNDLTTLRETFGESASPGVGYSVGMLREDVIDWPASEWLKGRSVWKGPIPERVVDPPFTFADGFEYKPGPFLRHPLYGYPLPPKAPTRKEWAALVAEHGLLTPEQRAARPNGHPHDSLVDPRKEHTHGEVPNPSEAQADQDSGEAAAEDEAF